MSRFTWLLVAQVVRVRGLRKKKKKEEEAPTPAVLHVFVFESILPATRFPFLYFCVFFLCSNVYENWICFTNLCRNSSWPSLCFNTGEEKCNSPPVTAHIPVAPGVFCAAVVGYELEGIIILLLLAEPWQWSPINENIHVWLTDSCCGPRWRGLSGTHRHMQTADWRCDLQMFFEHIASNEAIFKCICKSNELWCVFTGGLTGCKMHRPEVEHPTEWWSYTIGRQAVPHWLQQFLIVGINSVQCCPVSTLI